MQKTKFENEQERAMKEAEVSAYMKKCYQDRKKELLKELVIINEYLRRL